MARSAVRGTFSPTGPWRPTVAARLAPTLGCMGYVPPELVFHQKPGKFVCPRCEATSPVLVGTAGFRSYVQCAACSACYTVHREWLFRFVLVLSSALLAGLVLRLAVMPAVARGSLPPVVALVMFAAVAICSVVALFRPLRQLRQLRYVGRPST